MAERIWDMSGHKNRCNFWNSCCSFQNSQNPLRKSLGENAFRHHYMQFEKNMEVRF